MAYTLQRIVRTIHRLYGQKHTAAQIRNELDTIRPEPEVGQMVVIADTQGELPASQRFGMYIKLTDRNLYKTTGGTGKFFRLMTAEEISKCYNGGA